MLLRSSLECRGIHLRGMPRGDEDEGEISFVLKLYVHAHHAVLCFEWRDKNFYEQRLEVFDESKAQDEPPWKIERRKRLFAVVESLPQEFHKALQENEKADQGWERARRGWERARRKREKILHEYGIERLHAEVCLAKHPDCPWNGKTIFPEDFLSTTAS